jgi:hypothetical protein
MKKIVFIFLISSLFLSCTSTFSGDDILGEWYYEDGFDVNSKDSIFYHNTIVRFLEDGRYMYLKNNIWVSDSLTRWKVSNDIFFMGDGRAGTIINGDIVKTDNARWQASILQMDTIKGWFEVFTPPLKTDFVLIRKSN